MHQSILNWLSKRHMEQTYLLAGQGFAHYKEEEWKIDGSQQVICCLHSYPAGQSSINMDGWGSYWTWILLKRYKRRSGVLNNLWWHAITKKEVGSLTPAVSAQLPAIAINKKAKTMLHRSIPKKSWINPQVSVISSSITNTNIASSSIAIFKCKRRPQHYTTTTTRYVN